MPHCRSFFPVSTRSDCFLYCGIDWLTFLTSMRKCFQSGNDDHRTIWLHLAKTAIGSQIFVSCRTKGVHESREFRNSATTHDNARPTTKRKDDKTQREIFIEDRQFFSLHSRHWLSTFLSSRGMSVTVDVSVSSNLTFKISLQKCCHVKQRRLSRHHR
jgi:hypothetical protein